MALRKIAELEGHRVAEAANGVEALVLLGKRSFALAFVDIVMPVMHGVDLMEKMRGGFPDTKIVAVSALGASWIPPVELAIEGMLQKPFAVEDVRMTLRTLLS